MQSLADQVAVVTGAARGVGRGIAAVLAREGAHVVVCDVDGVAADSAASAFREQGLGSSALVMDVTDRASVDAGVARVLSDRGRIDIVAANAGIYPVATLSELDDDLWQR